MGTPSPEQGFPSQVTVDHQLRDSERTRSLLRWAVERAKSARGTSKAKRAFRDEKAARDEALRH